MALTITKPSEPILTSTLIMCIFGQPGIGKSSLAFSAKKPLLLDFDGGAQRAFGRKDVVRISQWSDVSSITAADVAGYDTIIIDTVGRALEYLSASLIAGNPKLKRSTGELSMQGYGALKTAYSSWLSTIRTFGKDIVLIAHEKEERNGDDVVVRLDAAGSTRTEVIRLSDLVGFVYADGSNRMLDFNPTSGHTGKNCAGFQALQIPHLAEQPKWLGDIFQQAKDQLNSMSAEQKEAEAESASWLEQISSIETVDQANEILTGIIGKPYEKLVKSVLHKKAKSLGYTANAREKRYEQATA